MYRFTKLSSIVLSLLMLAAISIPAYAQAREAEGEALWRLLDYSAVDYPGAVVKGKVLNQAEYSEMQEFSGTVVDGLAKLPQKPGRADLIAQGDELNTAIDNKVSSDRVARQSRLLATELLRSYSVPLTPKISPNVQNGKRLYAQNCTSCHGMSGNGQGPDAGQLDPAPVAFTDPERARERSLFALYQVIGQGLEGTAMQSFADLPTQDRWDIAAYVGGFAFAEASKGQELWKNDASIRSLFPDLAALVIATPANLGKQIGPEKADAVMAFLRSHPEAIEVTSSGSLALSRTKLKESIAAYQAGRKDEAETLALSAYLDGFEPLEPALAFRDPSLLKAIDRAMASVRAAIGDDLPVEEVENRGSALDGLFIEAESALDAEQASQASAFVGAFTILLREGLEALLIVVAMIAFLRKAERPEVMSYVHGGWIAALLAGGITWFAATYLIGVSGAGRELTEGFGALFAAVILLFVGLWMHSKLRADEWQRYIRETMSKALSRGSAWFLFGLAFIVVYREVFETILFFAALWTADNGITILAGSGAAIFLLMVIAWAMLRYSRKLPIGKFFAYSSALMVVLTVVLTGKGIAALQEAGFISVTPLSEFPQISMLGIFPTVQSIVAQLIAIGVIAIGYWYNTRKTHSS